MKIIFKEINEKNKEEVLKIIAQNVFIEVGVDREEVLEGLQKREEEVSTGLINEIAIPHVMINIEEGMLVILKNQDSIKDWETLDGSKVNFIISIIAPKDDEFHLKTLASISKKLMDEEVVDNLKKALTIDEVTSILDV